jgi:hypothetical protein
MKFDTGFPHHHDSVVVGSVDNSQQLMISVHAVLSIWGHQMRSLRSLLLVFAVALCGSSAVRADIVFDDFATASGALAGTSSVGPQVISPSGYNRSTSTGGGPLVNGSIGGGTANFNVDGANTFFRMDYSNFGTLNLHAINKVLRYTITATAGKFFDITYILNGPNGNLIASETYTGTGAAELHGFNFGPLNGLLASTVTSLTVRVTRTINNPGQAGAANVVLSGNMTAVPELGSMTLLGATGLAGYLVNRRRRNRNAGHQAV